MFEKISDKNFSIAILLDAYQESGSAKVVVQNLKSLPQDLCAFVILFNRGNSKPSELALQLQKHKIDFALVSEYCAFDPLVILRILRILRARTVQVIESNHYKTHLIALILSRYLRIPWIAVSHGWTSENRKMLLYNYLDRLTLPFATVCIAMGPTIAASLRQFLPKAKRPRTWPTAFDASEFSESGQPQDVRSELGIDSKIFIFGAIGRLSYEKGFDILLAASELLTKESDQFKILLIGSGTEQTRLKQLAIDLKITDKILFLGQKPAQKISSYYTGFDCLLIPSRSEGMPNVILEAAWFKIPVIASRVGGIPEMMRGVLDAWLFQVEDSRQLSSLMKTMIESSKQDRDLLGSELNIRLKSKYLAEQRTKKVHRMYRVVCKAFHRPGRR